MDIPKELQALIDMILRDLGGQNQIPINMLLTDVDGYLNALAHNGDQKWWQRRDDVVAAARNHQRYGDLINVLQNAVQALQNGGFFSLTLLTGLETAFPGGGNTDHAAFLVDLMLLIPGCHTLDALLWSDFAPIYNQYNNPPPKKPAFNCSALHRSCLNEIFVLQPNVGEQHLFVLIEHCIRVVVCHVPNQNGNWDAPSLVGAIETVASPQKKGNMNTRGSGIAGLIEAQLGITQPQGFLTRNIVVFLDIRYTCEAVNHLILGDVHFLDPVIADASCELRPPFILTAYRIVQGCVINNLGGLDQCKALIHLFYQNHNLDVWEERNITSVLEVMGATTDSYDYIRMVRHILQALRQVQDYYPDFLYLCKAMTRARYVTRDQFGIEVDDGERDCIFSINNDRAKRARLAEYTVRFIRETALALSNNPPFQGCDGITSVLPVLNTCNVGMMQKSAILPLLPIYSSEKISLAKCCMEGWPIVLRFSRVQYLQNTNDYRLLGTAVLIYIPNNDHSSYHLAGTYNGSIDGGEWLDGDQNILTSMPSICVSAFSICSSVGQLENDIDFRSEDFTVYLNALKQCDIVHLISLCSANHPPFPIQAGTRQGNNVQQFQHGQDHVYQWNTLYGSQPPQFDETNTQLTLRSPYNFMNTPIIGEHLEIFRLANRYRLDDRLYLNNGERQHQEVHFYSIHLYTSSFRIERLRVRRVWDRCQGQTIGRILDVDTVRNDFDQETQGELDQARNI